MKHTALTATLATLLSLGLATAAAADCRPSEVRVENGSDIRVDSYDPFEARDVEERFNLSVTVSEGRNNACRGGDLQVAFVPVTSADLAGDTLLLRNGSETLRARIVDNRGTSRLHADQASAFQSPITDENLGANPRTRRVGPFEVEVEAGQTAPQGTYTARVGVLVRIQQDGTVVRREIDVRVDVDGSVRLQRGAGGDTLDFGEITDDDRSDTATFTAWHNVGYRLTVTSENDFQLRTGSRSADGIDYSITIDGQALERVDNDTVTLSRSRNRTTGSQPGRNLHELRAEIDGVVDAVAGEYSDSITIRIAPDVGGGRG